MLQTTFSAKTRSIIKCVVTLTLLLPSAAIHRAMAQTPEALPALATPIAASSSTVVPMLVRYDGAAIQIDGKPKTGAGPVTFLIFKDEKAGEPLWTETQTVAFEPAGKYEVYLGATYSSGLPTDLFGTGEARWLEVQIAGETPGPRTLLTSVPYALKAADATTLGGLPASAFALAGTTGLAAVTANGITPDATASNVTTTGGTSHYIPAFTGASTVANSEIYDTGTSVGIGDVPAAGARLDVNGAMILRGNMTVLGTGNATASKSYPSYGVEFFSNAYNSSTKAVDGPYFQLQSEPTGNNTASPSATFNLLFANNGKAVAETGLYFNPSGTIHFASGQTFPGTGNGDITGVTAGTGLTGGGTSGNVTLNLNTTLVPTLSGTNSFTGSNTFGASINARNTDVNIDNTNSNKGNISPGLRFGNASGEGMSSKRTSGTNQYGLDLYTDYAARLSVTTAGFVGINTRTPGAQLEVDSQTPGSATVEVAAVIATSTYGDGAEFTGGSNTDADGDGGNGVFGIGGSVTSSGVASGSGGYFEAGSATGASGNNGTSPGVYGMGGATDLGIGGYGGFFEGGDNVSADGTPGEGLYAEGGYNYNNNAYGPNAGMFDGDVSVNGTLSANAKNFQIDDPRDPANKYLNHSSIESSEMMNLYTGNVTTDSNGVATVTLPEWFETINSDFRYQLTIIGKRAQAWVSQEVDGGRFQISTDTPNVKVSWQITGVRHDPYAKAHPLIVEQVKDIHERGFYKNPELYAQPRERQTEWGRHPEMMRRMEAMRQRRKAMMKNMPGARGRQVATPFTQRAAK